MQVMILEQDQIFQARIAAALMEKGFHVICVETIAAAEAFIRLGFVDLLVLGERVGGRLSHAVALLAECRNPLVTAILLTDRTGADLDEVFELVPAVYGILGREMTPDVVAQVVLSAASVSASDTVRSRLSSRWAEAERAIQAEGANDVILLTPEMQVLPEAVVEPPELVAEPPTVVESPAPVEPGMALPWAASANRIQTVAGVMTGWLQESALPVFECAPLDLPDLDAMPPPVSASAVRRLHLA